MLEVVSSLLVEDVVEFDSDFLKIKQHWYIFDGDGLFSFGLGAGDDFSENLNVMESIEFKPFDQHLLLFLSEERL